MIQRYLLRYRETLSQDMLQCVEYKAASFFALLKIKEILDQGGILVLDLLTMLVYTPQYLAYHAPKMFSLAQAHDLISPNFFNGLSNLI